MAAKARPAYQPPYRRRPGRLIFPVLSALYDALHPVFGDEPLRELGRALNISMRTDGSCAERLRLLEASYYRHFLENFIAQP